MTPAPVWNRDNLNSASAFAQTTLAYAQARARFQLEDATAQHNANMVTEYGIQWEEYRQSRDERPDATNLIQPMPAVARVVQLMPNGWPEAVDSTDYVTPPKVYQPPKTTAVTWFHAGDPSGAAAVDPFAGAVLFGTPIDHAGMKFLRVA